MYVFYVRTPKRLGENVFHAVHAAGRVGVGSLGLRKQQWSRKEGEEARVEINRWKYRQNKGGQRGRQEPRRQREPHCMLDGNQVCQTDTGPDSRRWSLNYLASPVAHIATFEKKNLTLTWILDQKLLFQFQALCVCALIKKKKYD